MAKLPKDPLDDLSVEKLGDNLEGKTIAMLVTGGIAAYKTPSLARHFRQYGADVLVYMTPEARRFVAEDTLAWASANPVVSELSSGSEHLRDFIDVYVVAPATYNTIGKFASGVADNAVTTTFASALGRLEKGGASAPSILVAPAMHSTMENSVYKANLDMLAGRGVRIITPDYRMGKANLPGSHHIVVHTMREASGSSLKGKRILVTAGPTPANIDNVRMITNRFRGRLGIMIADEAYMRGADVRLVLGATGMSPPQYLDTAFIRSFQEYLSTVMRELCEKRYDFGIFSAAVADYVPFEAKEGKIPSKGALRSIPLKETPKVISEVREKFPQLFMVTFKYEERVSREKLEEIARHRVSEGYQVVVANRIEDMAGSHHAIIFSEKGILAEPCSKKETATRLLDVLEKEMTYEKDRHTLPHNPPEA